MTENQSHIKANLFAMLRAEQKRKEKNTVGLLNASLSHVSDTVPSTQA